MAAEAGGVRLPGEATSASVFVQIGGADVEAGKLYSHRRRGTESASFAYAEELSGQPSRLFRWTRRCLCCRGVCRQTPDRAADLRRFLRQLPGPLGTDA